MDGLIEECSKFLEERYKGHIETVSVPLYGIGLGELKKAKEVHTGYVRTCR